jgi:hypothetical protein
MSNPDMPSTGFTMKWAFLAAIALAILLIIPTTLVLAVQPAWMGFQRETMKQSHQYVEAKESMLLQWVDEYNSLEVEALKYEANDKTKLAEGLRLQQESLLARIKTEAQRIPADALPPSVKDFLEKHP